MEQGVAGIYTLFSHFDTCGLTTAATHRETYPGFVEALDAAGITPEAVQRVLHAFDFARPLATMLH